MLQNICKDLQDAPITLHKSHSGYWEDKDERDKENPKSGLKF